MRRDPKQLSGVDFDLLVVGGGIYGACIARDAAMRGLRVALIEKGDFGAATSHNSLKLIHGGLRYLQHLDFGRVRRSIRERRIWAAIAPHLIRPLQFLMPTYGHGTRGPEALWAALRLHGLVGFDRNRGLEGSSRYPGGRIASRKEVERLVPGLATEGLTGGAIWYDGQMSEADRIVLECLRSAMEHEAVVTNHVEAECLIASATRVTGVRARDLIDGSTFEVRAGMVVNATGPWIASLLRDLLVRQWPDEPGWSKGMNLVTRKVTVGQAVGLASGRASDAKLGRTRRLFFMTPWKDCTAIGSSHLPYREDPREYRFSERDIVEFLGEINECFSLGLSREDIHYCYAGLTPADDDEPEETSRSRKDDLVDHDHDHGITGLISVVGAKFTTSRHVAEKTVDLVFEKLGRAVPICTASSTPLPGARDFDASEIEIGADPRGLEIETQLKATYGSRWSEVLRHHPRGASLDDRACFHAQCHYAVEHEMAVTLCDVLMGRTDRAARGVLTPEDVAWCAEMLSERLAWDDARRRKETEQLSELLSRHGQQLDRAERSCT